MRKLPLSVRAVTRASRKIHRLAAAKRFNVLLARAGLRHARAIHTFTTTEELHVLAELAMGVPDGGNIVEIGSYVGASTCFLAAGTHGRNIRIVCVDTWQNETMPDGVRDTYGEFQDNLRPVLDRVTPLRVRSEAITSDQMPDEIDLVFLDGDHSYTACRRDFLVVAPRVAPNGVIAFHDTVFFRGVSRVMGEALATGEWRLDGCCGNLSWIRRCDFTHGDAPDV